MNSTTTDKRPHPRSIAEPDALKPGMRVELVEDDQVIEKGTVTSTGRYDGKPCVDFQKDGETRSERFIHFQGPVGWKWIFPGLSGELCFTPEGKGKSYAFRGLFDRPIL